MIRGFDYYKKSNDTDVLFGFFYPFIATVNFAIYPSFCGVEGIFHTKAPYTLSRNGKGRGFLCGKESYRRW